MSWGDEKAGSVVGSEDGVLGPREVLVVFEPPEKVFWCCFFECCCLGVVVWVLLLGCCCLGVVAWVLLLRFFLFMFVCLFGCLFFWLIVCFFDFDFFLNVFHRMSAKKCSMQVCRVVSQAWDSPHFGEDGVRINHTRQHTSHLIRQIHHWLHVNHLRMVCCEGESGKEGCG